VFEFTGRHPTEPTNWQRPENWKLNGEPASRPPGTGPDDRVTITGFEVSNPASTVTDLILTGSLSGGFLNVNRNCVLNGGAIIACTVTLLDNSSLTSSSSGLNAFNSCVVNNRGTFSPLALSLGSLGAQAGTVLYNEVLTGKIWLGDDATITMTGGARIESDGPVLKLAGPGTAAIAGGLLDQTGAGYIECAGGMLSVGTGITGRLVTDRPLKPSGAGSIIHVTGFGTELRTGANIIGPGFVRVQNALLSGSITAENLQINDGATFEGPGDLAVVGTFDFRGGVFQGVSLNGTVSVTPKLDIQPGGTLQFAHGSGNPVLTRNISNAGTIVARAGPGPGVALAAVSPPVLENLVGGLIVLSGTTGLGNRSINNAGTILKTNNTDLSSGIVFTRACTNSGLVDVQTGLLRFSGFQQTVGELRIAAGAEARFNSGLNSISGGAVSGNGTLRGLFSSSAATLGGTLRPGSSPGTFTIVKGEDSIAFAPGSRIEIEIGGPAAGSQYDQLILTSGFGNFPLAGAVDVRFINGLVPSPGQTFSIVRYTPNRSGSFSAITGLASAPGALLVPRYTASGLDLVVATNPALKGVSASATSFKLNFTTSSGFNYQVQASTNLVNWTSLGAVILGDGLTKELTDSITGAPSRCYRLRVE
jgi:hypothetical protein